MIRTLLILLAVVGCAEARSDQASGGQQLPTGVVLDPAGRSFDVGSMPLNLLPAPEADRAVLVLSGWREQGIQVVQPSTGAVLQTLTAPSAFIGATFSPNHRALYVSGGNQDLIYRYRWDAGAALMDDSIALAVRAPHANGTRYPAGLAFSPDGNTLYVAENLADSLAVVRVADGKVAQRVPSGRYPYAVAVTPAGEVYVSAWGASEVRRFVPGSDGRLTPGGSIDVARHPSALLLNRSSTRLFVASGSTDRISVVDLATRKVIATLEDPPPAGPGEGSTPNALALSDDGTRLFVAEADANAVAVFDLSAATSGAKAASGTDRLVGRIPVGWYPTGLMARGDTLIVANGKGRGAGPNGVNGPSPANETRNPRAYTLGQLSGTVTVVPGALARPAQLTGMTQRVVAANHWSTRRTGPTYPPFQHVIYVIKENRTYDQVFGDLPQGDGDSSLVFFPRAVSPNHHALAERFGLFDRFLVNSEVSADGHNWSTAAYATDYVQKTTPSNYSSRGRTYDYEGTNRGVVPADKDADDAAEPANGYLWDLAKKKGITFRNYGEFMVPRPGGSGAWAYRGSKPFLEANSNHEYPGFDLSITDQHRADIWIADLQKDVQQGSMPALEIIHLPNDHTEGAKAGSPTPRAYMADNDLALGRIVEALSKTPFWSSTVMFVLEDDAQNGPDHVDSHRSPLLVISPYARPGVIHRFANTTDVLVTMEEILGLAQLSQFDYYGRPLREIWSPTPDSKAYAAITPSISLTERNVAMGPAARESDRMDFSREDRADDDTFNRVLWAVIKGNTPYPGARRIAALELKRSR